MRNAPSRAVTECGGTGRRHQHRPIVAVSTPSASRRVPSTGEVRQEHDDGAAPARPRPGRRRRRRRSVRPLVAGDAEGAGSEWRPSTRRRSASGRRAGLRHVRPAAASRAASSGRLDREGAGRRTLVLCGCGELALGCEIGDRLPCRGGANRHSLHSSSDGGRSGINGQWLAVERRSADRRLLNPKLG